MYLLVAVADRLETVILGLGIVNRLGVLVDCSAAVARCRLRLATHFLAVLDGRSLLRRVGRFVAHNLPHWLHLAAARDEA